MSEIKYRLVASPWYETVSPGAIVTHRCQQQYAVMEAVGAPQDQFQWFRINDTQAVKEKGAPHAEKGPAAPVWQATWNSLGRHELQCHVEFAEGGRHVYTQVQTVEATDAILARELERSRKEGCESPEAVRNTLRRYVEAMEAAEKATDLSKLSEVVQREYRKRHSAYKAYLAKLEEVLAPTEGKVRYPIQTVHLATESQERSTLRVFLASGSNKAWSATEIDWTLVDWTDPTDRARTGVYTGSGKNDVFAIESAINSWDSGFAGNRYPQGVMKYEVPAYIANGNPLSGSFKTTGHSYFDRITTVLEWVGMAAAGTAMVITLVAPVPGSALVSAMIWTSVFSSTAAATLNIGMRHEEGFGSWQDDAFDTLTIVGNLFAGSGIWMKGATITARSVAGKALKGVLIGQIATDSVQGVVLGLDYVGEYDKLMADKSLAPDERVNRCLQLFRSALVAGAMIYVSVKGTAKDLQHLNKRPKYLGAKGADSAGSATAGTKEGPPPTPSEKLQSLKDSKTTVELTDPVLEGHTRDGKVTGEVQTAQQRQHAEQKVGSPFETDPEFAKSSEWRVRTIEQEKIELREYDGGPSTPKSDDWKFKAEYEDGTVTVDIATRKVDSDGTVRYSSKLRAKNCYAAMFKHFEKNGLKIKKWAGALSADNFAIAKSKMDLGLTPEQAVLEVHTAKFWKAWAETQGLEIRVLFAEVSSAFGQLYFEAEFVPKAH